MLVSQDLLRFAETTEDLVDEQFNTNFKGNYLTVQKALPLLNDGGAIVFTTSWLDEVGIAGTSVASASKAALRSLTRTLARTPAAKYSCERSRSRSYRNSGAQEVGVGNRPDS